MHIYICNARHSELHIYTCLQHATAEIKIELLYLLTTESYYMVTSLDKGTTTNARHSL